MASTRTERIFVVLNPASGGYSAAVVNDALGRHFGAAGEGPVGHDALYEIHETREGEHVADIVREVVTKGFDVVVAAGGDGTVSAVANGLLGSEAPLGILPLGTANVLARELGIPVDLELACGLLAGPHATARIDAMRVAGICYLTQVGVGVDAMMIRDTGREAKRRFGRAAYLWTAFLRLVGFAPRRFHLTIDGRVLRPRASQVVIANCGILGQPPFRWGPGIRPDDGRLDVCVIRGRNLWDYAKIAYHVILGQHRRSPNVRYLTAERSITVATKRDPLPVQADGEVIGETPIDVELVRGAVCVVVPESRSITSQG